MGAYQCLQCGALEEFDENMHSKDCCGNQELFRVNDMPGEILKLRAALAKQPSSVDARAQMGAACDDASAKYFATSGRAPMLREHVYGDAYAQGWFDHATLAQQQGRDAEFLKKIQSAINSVEVPASIPPVRAEYYKAGARAVIAKVNAAIAAARGE